MSKRHIKLLLHIKRVTIAGLIVGGSIFGSSFFITDPIHAYLLHIGLGLIVSSMLIFGFGMFVSLMGEVNTRKPIKPAKNSRSQTNGNKLNNKFQMSNKLFVIKGGKL
ncbi:hypothetical protein [Effusibacillus consociatus]|uniref:Cytochrome b561 domain-containing protein n=1 Tax=Effusibacillus consociatus TaxID=1117041 RepID=A0ABV9Q1T5_9BACL